MEYRSVGQDCYGFCNFIMLNSLSQIPLVTSCIPVRGLDLGFWLVSEINILHTVCRSAIMCADKK